MTSFEQEDLEVEFPGDSSDLPDHAPQIFALEALQNARNVTLMFAPTTPEVMPNSPVGKVAELPVVSVPVSPPVANPDLGPSAATSSTTQSASSSSAVDSSATTAASASTTADASATDSGSSTVTTEQASATPSDAGAGDSSSAATPNDLMAAVTPTQAIEAKVYDVGASDTADASSGSSSNSTAAAATTLSTNGTDSGSSMVPTMTPVSTAPYEWMFKNTNASP